VLSSLLSEKIFPAQESVLLFKPYTTSAMGTSCPHFAFALHPSTSPPCSLWHRQVRISDNGSKARDVKGLNAAHAGHWDTQRWVFTLPAAQGIAPGLPTSFVSS